MLEKIKRFFCKHDYKKIAKRKSTYCQDYHTFSDMGWWDDNLYKCIKCGQLYVKTVPNKNHPCCPSEWEYLDKEVIEDVRN